MTNPTVLYDLGVSQYALLEDNIELPNVTTQAGAFRIKGEVVRVTGASANSTLILGAVLSGEGAPITYVVNDSGQTVVVYCAAGENLDGSANGTRSIANGATGIFFRVPNHLSGPDWRSTTVA